MDLKYSYFKNIFGYIGLDTPLTLEQLYANDEHSYVIVIYIIYAPFIVQDSCCARLLDQLKHGYYILRKF